MTAVVERRPTLFDKPIEVFEIAGRRLRHLRRAPGRFLGITLNPLVSMLVLGYLFKQSISVPGGDYLDYLFAGVAIQVGLAGVGPTAIAVASDLQGGLVDRFRSLPISRSAVLVGHTFADLLVSVLGLAVVAVFGLLLGWRPAAGFGSVLAGFGVVLAFSYVVLWLGVVMGIFIRKLESIDAISTLVVVVLPFLSSAFLSTGNLPAWLRPVAEWNPISVVVTTVRSLWGYPQAAEGFAGAHAALLTPLWLLVLLGAAASLSVHRYRTAHA